MQKFHNIIGFLFLTILISCQYDPYAHNYTTTKPNESDLVGKYTFERQTVDNKITEFTDSKKNQTVIPKIEINENGTYNVVNLPVFETFDANFKGLISKNGEWKILTVGSIGDGSSGNRKKHWGIYLSGLPNELKNPGLMNKKSPYRIVFGFGDPDSGKVMIFKKD